MTSAFMERRKLTLRDMFSGMSCPEAGSPPGHSRPPVFRPASPGRGKAGSGIRSIARPSDPDLRPDMPQRGGVHPSLAVPYRPFDRKIEPRGGFPRVGEHLHLFGGAARVPVHFYVRRPPLRGSPACMVWSPRRVTSASIRAPWEVGPPSPGGRRSTAPSSVTIRELP